MIRTQACYISEPQPAPTTVCTTGPAGGGRSDDPTSMTTASCSSCPRGYGLYTGYGGTLARCNLDRLNKCTSHCSSQTPPSTPDLSASYSNPACQASTFTTPPSSSGPTTGGIYIGGVCCTCT